MLKIDLSAPIIPNKSIGNICLRDKISQLKKNIGIVDNSKYELISPFDARYYLKDRSIEVGVDVRYGRIFNITARKGYLGKLFEQIQVGMKLEFILNSFKEFYYDEDSDMFLSKEHDGVGLDIGSEKNCEIISGISIFASEFIEADQLDKELIMS
jgi:hypothetical protein